MLRRAWIVVSALWTFAVLGFTPHHGRVANGQGIDWLELLFPWVLGLAIWLCWRFIRGPRRKLPQDSESHFLQRY